MINNRHLSCVRKSAIIVFMALMHLCYRDKAELSRAFPSRHSRNRNMPKKKKTA